MADVTQATVELLAHAALTNADSRAGLSVAGTERDVRTYLSGTVHLYHALVEAAGNSPGMDYILQGRYSTGAAANEDWIDIWKHTTGIAAGISAAISGTEAIGQTDLGVATITAADFPPGADCYIQDAGTLTDSEWGKIAHSTTSVISVVDGLIRAKDASDFVWNNAEKFIGSVSLDGISYVRMIVQNHDGATGADTHHMAQLVAFTDIE